MLDHIGFGVADFKRSKAFYSQALAPLGYKLVMQVSLSEDGEDGYAGFGDDRPHFWIGTGKPLQSRLHVAFVAKTRAEVRAFYEAAIAAYSSSAGRYQHEPDSLNAYVQIANCYERLQKPAEALSTLAQAQLILKQLPESAFTIEPSAMSRDDWQHWLDWAMKLHN